MRTLQTLGQHLSAVTDYPEFYSRAHTALLSNPIDIPLVSIYSTRQTFPEHHDYSFDGSQAGRSDVSVIRTGHSDVPSTLTREFIFGCDETHPAFPERISFDQSVEDDTELLDLSSYIKQGCQGTQIIKIPENVVKKELRGAVDGTWNELISHVVVFPICPLDREGTQAVAIVGSFT